MLEDRVKKMTIENEILLAEISRLRKMLEWGDKEKQTVLDDRSSKKEEDYTSISRRAELPSERRRRLELESKERLKKKEE